MLQQVAEIYCSCTECLHKSAPTPNPMEKIVISICITVGTMFAIWCITKMIREV